MLSIVPPADALPTATRVLAALLSLPTPRTEPLAYVDLNAVSPRSARELASLLLPHPALVSFHDGAIIGGPPSQGADGTWSTSKIPVSGPALPAYLSAALGSYHIDEKIGSASGLKMCFASLTKGYTAIAVQAFTTAHRLGVLDHLNEVIETTIPGVKARLEKGVTACPPKAYRWVREMEEIGATHREDGGWGLDMFGGAAEVFQVMAGLFGEEKVGDRKRGLTVEDVAGVVAGGLAEVDGEGEEGGRGGKRRRTDGGEETV